MILTRIGKNCRMILAGDPNQIQLKQKSKSGLQRLIDIEDLVDDMIVVELTQNHRSPFVEQIIEHY